MMDERGSHEHMPVALVRVGATDRYLFAGQTLRIGRDPHSDLVADDPRVSRSHASIQSDPRGQVVLSDLGSVNGTYAAGSRVDNRYLAGDETFCLGSLDGPPVSVWLNGARPRISGMA